MKLHNYILLLFLKSISLTFLLVSGTFANEVKNSATVFMYHKFGVSKYPSTSVTIDQLNSHIEELTKEKYTIKSLDFIIDKKGIVVTNNHVIQDADDIIIRVGDKEIKAKVLGADPLSDIAVLQLETNEKFKPVQFGDSDKARIGDWVIAIGNPFGLGGTVTSGIISARNRSIGFK